MAATDIFFFRLVCEVAFQAIARGKIVNRGFFNGPICPIYGVGMLGVLLLLQPIADDLLWLFFGGMFFATFVELVGGSILDRIFHMRWWDYSEEPYNFRGYICLRFSVIWGLAVVGVVKIIQPPIMLLVNLIPEKIGWILLIIIAVVFAADAAATLRSLIGLRQSLGEFNRIALSLHNMSDDLTLIVSSSALKVDGDIKNIRTKAEETAERQKAATLEKQQELNEKFADSVKQFNEKIEKVKEDRKKKKSDLSEKLATESARLEKRYNIAKRKIGKSFGRRRIFKAYPQLHRSFSRNTLQNEIDMLEVKIKKLSDKNSHHDINKR